jgi:regulation of enolase protein 1 (concanavalin A-like superfamily)
MDWLNEPPHWRAHGQRLVVTSEGGTDFWRKTTDGMVRDSGHFYHQRVEGDFVAEVRFSGEYREQYDQSGLMVRLDEATWMKAGIEVFGGVPHAGVVVTRDFSDWSLEPLMPSPQIVWLRVLRRGSAFEVHLSFDADRYRMIRQCQLTRSNALSVGVMTASPLGGGFTTVFEDFEVLPQTETAVAT